MNRVRGAVLLLGGVVSLQVRRWVVTWYNTGVDQVDLGNVEAAEVAEVVVHVCCIRLCVRVVDIAHAHQV